MNHKHRLLAGIAFLGCLTTAVQADELTPLSQEKVVVARSTGQALLLWDATNDLATLLQQKQQQPVIVGTLEARGLRLLGDRAATLKDASTVSIRIVYQKTSTISPTYGTPTFAGIERLITMTAAKSVLQHLTPAAYDAVRMGKSVPGVTVEMSGQLPPVS